MLPSVSVIVPCLNEEKRIRKLLDAIYSQTYPGAQLSVIIADGGSTDHSRAVITQFQSEHPFLRLQVVDNPLGTIPAGLNCAIKASDGEILLRLDAHSAPYPDYVENSVNALLTGKGQNVGGVWEIHPGSETWIARSIARAAAHPLGVGDALYRHAQKAAIVDTVPFGCFRRSLVDQIGGYDETLLTNEDYEFNTRIRQIGGRIWLDPTIRSVYFARPDMVSLAQQYIRYGFWKLKMLRRYPGTLRWRQALPPLFTVSLLVGFVLSIFSRLFGWLLLIELAGYFLILGSVSLRLAFKNKEFFLIAGLPLAIAVMHIAWGGGFLWSIFSEKWNS
ncbi:MAG: glycosyltransferase family 2 protein [Chloroflexota bacterium]